MPKNWSALPLDCWLLDMIDLVQISRRCPGDVSGFGRLFLGHITPVHGGLFLWILGSSVLSVPLYAHFGASSWWRVRGASSGSVLWPIPAGPAEPSPFAVLEFSYEGLFLEAYRLLLVDTGNESSVL